MSILEKRDYIHNFLYLVDESVIDEMFNKVQSIVEKEIYLSETQQQELLRRVDRHKKGESESFSWEEVKKRQIP
jgi:putative addiction module component (TIGR02574 family)